MVLAQQAMMTVSPDIQERLNRLSNLNKIYKFLQSEASKRIPPANQEFEERVRLVDTVLRARERLDLIRNKGTATTMEFAAVDTSLNGLADGIRLASLDLLNMDVEELKQSEDVSPIATLLVGLGAGYLAGKNL